MFEYLYIRILKQLNAQFLKLLNSVKEISITTSDPL